MKYTGRTGECFFSCVMWAGLTPHSGSALVHSGEIPLCGTREADTLRCDAWIDVDRAGQALPANTGVDRGCARAGGLEGAADREGVFDGRRAL